MADSERGMTWGNGLITQSSQILVIVALVAQ